MELAGQNALVTGGAVRLGRALVELLGDEGCRIAVHHHRSAAAAGEVVDALRDRGVEATVLGADLEDPDAPTRLVDEAIRSLGSLEILVNNAAIFPDAGFLDTTAASWDRQMAVNLRAPFLLSRRFAERLGEGDEGQILNLGDRRVRRPGTDHFAYRLAKLSLTEMTRMLALELAPRIRVNALAPGAILPPPGELEESFRERTSATVPLQRPGGVGALTRAARFLLTGDFETGVVLPVDGGEYL